MTGLVPWNGTEFFFMEQVLEDFMHIWFRLNASSFYSRIRGLSDASVHVYMYMYVYIYIYIPCNRERLSQFSWDRSEGEAERTKRLEGEDNNIDSPVFVLFLFMPLSSQYG